MAPRRQMLCMMPEVHDRVIKNVFKGTISDFHVRVIEVSDSYRYDMENEKIIQSKADHGQRDVLN